jgi:hypothetical protein
MSDFLARLAARAVGCAAFVTPRPAAVFAPVADPAPPEPQSSEATVQAPSSAAVAPEQASSPAANAAQELVVDSRAMHAPPTATADEHVPRQATYSAAERPAPQVSRHPEHEAGRANPDWPPLDRPAGGDAATRAPPGNTDASAAARVVPQVPTAIMAARTWDGGTAGGLPLSRHAPPATAPTVHISIGRVEVRANRAASDAPKTPRKAEAPQQLSLGDYLRRDGGGRR